MDRIVQKHKYMILTSYLIALVPYQLDSSTGDAGISFNVNLLHHTDAIHSGQMVHSCCLILFSEIDCISLQLNYTVLYKILL